MNQNKLPKKVFILRNNDLGDVLVATPLVRGIKEAFPESHISLGVGDWAARLLENNPYLDEVVHCNAPWHNKQNCRFPANSPRTFLEGLTYVLCSREARYIRRQRYTHGIDFLGSRQGSWLFKRASIKNRYGVRGYAGGDTWCTDCVDFRENRNVTKAGLAFLKLLGAEVEIEPRPLLFLTESEQKEAENRWRGRNSESKRIILAPGGGFPEKCWGNESYSELVTLLLKHTQHQICIIGSNEDHDRIASETWNNHNRRVQNLCGYLSLRQSAALVSRSDFVFSNTSFCMHLAGAFRIPSIILLGHWYDSAKLHADQWGYPEGKVLGREVSEGQFSILSSEEAYKTFSKLID